jgi:serine O-acetyltransferase
MPHHKLQQLKRLLRRMWVFSPEQLWLASIALAQRGHWILAFWLKQVNGLIYHNSLSPGARVGRDVWLGHNSLGIVVNANVEIGNNVLIWHHVTLAAGRPGRGGREDGANGRAVAEREGPGVARIVIEDNVTLGTGAIVIAPRGTTLRIGAGARIGAGTVVTADVPPKARLVGARPRIVGEDEQPGESG